MSNNPIKLIFATHNLGKLEEMRVLLQGLKIETLGAQEVGINEEVLEDGVTFAENALKKARFFAEKSNHWAVADDSGLCIQALGGAPGVFSARWAGENASDEELVRYTLDKIKDIPQEKRGAWFESAVALVSPQGKHRIFKGKIEGWIAQEPRGKPRPKLPYDSIFIPRGYNQTFAQISEEEKNKIGHRGLAFQKLKEFLSKWL